MQESSARWTHPSVILVATDLSDLDRLIPFALRDAADAGARLILIHVLNASAAIAVDAVGMPYYDPASALDFAAQDPRKLARHRAGEEHRLRRGWCARATPPSRLPRRPVSSKPTVFFSEPGAGARSASSSSDPLQKQVLRSVNLPVMTVGPEAHLPVTASDTPAVVLHATTLREASRRAQRLPAKSLPAAAHGSSWCMSCPRMPPAKAQTAKPKMPARPSCANWPKPQPTPSTVAPPAWSRWSSTGNPAIEILAASAKLRASADRAGSHAALGSADPRPRPHHLSRVGPRALPGAHVA